MSRFTKIVLACAVSAFVVVGGVLELGVGWFLLDRHQNRVLQKAAEALAKHDWGRAITLFDKALKLPLLPMKAAWAHSARGQAETESGKYADAIRDLSEALRLNPKAREAYWGRGYAYQLNGELDKALNDYDEFLRYDENAGRVYFNRGLIHLQRKEWAKAAQDFSESLRCEPENSYAYFERGTALLELHDLDGALASFDSAIAIKTNLAEAYTARAGIYELKGESARASEDALRAMQLAPRPPPRTWNPPMVEPSASASELGTQAWKAQSASRYDEAIDLCNKALDANPNTFQTSAILMTRGNSYGGKGDWDRALRDYEEAVRLVPNNADALTNRGNAYAHKRQLDKSTTDYNEAIRLNPKLFQAFYNRALNYLATADLNRALADLTECIRLNPKFEQAYEKRAIVFVRLKRRDEGLRDAEMAVSLNPDNADAYHRRAEVRMARREFPQARGDFDRMLEHIRPGQSTFLNDASWFFATCPDKACRDGKRAVELATKACETQNWKDAHILDTLAATFAEIGDFDQAIKRQSEALKLYEEPGELRTGMQKRLALYQKHHAYRDDGRP
ncbi:MAG: tetratricopeptide repeat protein [Chthoniobacterales bacterium]